MGKISLNERTVTVKEGVFKKVSLPLDSLRLLYLIAPGSFKWFVVTSSSRNAFINLDSLPGDTFKKLLNELSEQMEKEKAYRLTGIKLCLKDYEDNATLITLRDLKLSKADLFEKLLEYREERLRRLKDWLKDEPEVRLKGAVLNKEGFHNGKKKFIAWQDVGAIQSETVNFNTSILLLPEGSGGGMFNFKRYKYSIQRIPEKHKEIYMAECNFWHSL
jgi:hypothetical protein